ncbi:O-methyltransferase-domain-containing protein [Crucibulum laeve]|uniref:O-methyltransferase-domain-containing protein n=1 Tax=Crucibulum laeve TaxID=68775 RepID=A0A5C3LGU5_9AGAR|nr:O-methyltransferase-domain-containing protein [Crucibulum laeve]
MSLPSNRLYEASKRIISAAGMLQVILKDPKDHVMEVSAQYFESRALHAASRARIPDLLHEASKQGQSEGLTISEIATKTGYDPIKCGRIMRLLATCHIFKQTGPESFSNNRVSAALVGNRPLSSYIDMYGAEWYSSSQHLIDVLSDPSSDLESAAFTKDTLYNKDGQTYWNYNDNNPDRHDMFAIAMSGSAQNNTQALLEDYPWDKLGKAVIVDVGGGIGALSASLLLRFPQLSAAIQDRGSVIAQGKSHWETTFATAVESGRVRFQVADFFESPNQVSGAEVYMLRYIMDDWKDDACIKILSAIRAAMNSNSRVLIVEALLIPSWISDQVNDIQLVTAPSPLLPNYGVAQKFVHFRDMNMMSLINGTERTVSEMSKVVQDAGLKVSKVWQCRGDMCITECVLP